MQFDLILAFLTLNQVNKERILHAKNEKCKSNNNSLDSHMDEDFQKFKLR